MKDSYTHQHEKALKYKAEHKKQVTEEYLSVTPLTESFRISSGSINA